jgi:ribosome biogenesis GTPase
MNDLLKTWGWDPYFDEQWRKADPPSALAPARLVAEHKDLYQIVWAGGEGTSRLAGRFRHASTLRSDLPAVGDWVGMEVPKDSDDGIVQIVLPRRTCFARKLPGARHEEQVVAANMDKVFLVTGLDGDFNMRRIERYLALAYTSGADPVVVLTKADLYEDIPGLVAEAQAHAPGVPVLAVSGVTGENIPALREHLAPGRTVALLGSSGAGKSTLINHLLGEERQATMEVRGKDFRGRHTTTHRELFLLPGGALMIDNPGMREIQLWAADEGIEEAFPEIRELAERCRFRDCRHEQEPGCAVRSALEAGTLDEGRFDGYMKLKKEQAYIARKTDPKAREEHKRMLKSRNKSLKDVYRFKGRE